MVHTPDKSPYTPNVKSVEKSSYADYSHHQNPAFSAIFRKLEISDIYDFNESELVMGVISVSKEFFIRIDKDKLVGSHMMNKAAHSKNEMRLTENEACLLRDLSVPAVNLRLQAVDIRQFKITRQTMTYHTTGILKP